MSGTTQTITPDQSSVALAVAAKATPSQNKDFTMQYETSSIVEPSVLDASPLLEGLTASTEHPVPAFSLDSLEDTTLESSTPPPGEEEITTNTTTNTNLLASFQISGNPVSICLGAMFEVLKNQVLAAQLTFKQSSTAIQMANDAAELSQSKTYHQADEQYKATMTEVANQATSCVISGVTTVAPMALNSDLNIRGKQIGNGNYTKMGAAEADATAARTQMDVHETTINKCDAELKTVNTGHGTEMHGGASREATPPTRSEAEERQLLADKQSLINEGKVQDRAEGASIDRTTAERETARTEALKDMKRTGHADNYKARLAADRANASKELEAPKAAYEAATKKVNTYQSRISSTETMTRGIHDILTNGVGAICKGAGAVYSQTATYLGADAKIQDNIQHNAGSLADSNRSQATKYLDEGITALQQIASCRQASRVAG